MELILCSSVFTLLAVVGAFVDVLITSTAPRNGRHGAADSAEPRRIQIVEPSPDFVPEYDPAA